MWLISSNTANLQVPTAEPRQAEEGRVGGDRKRRNKAKWFEFFGAPDHFCG